MNSNSRFEVQQHQNQSLLNGGAVALTSGSEPGRLLARNLRSGEILCVLV
jgi:hypothetical protein